MAIINKNLVITPNIGSSTDDPKIVFSTANTSTIVSNITVRAYPTNSGMLSFEGSAGQLFSVTNSLTGTIFSVNDISGIPSIEVLDTGVLRLAQFSGNVGIGTATPAYKLDVSGPINTNSNVSISGNINLTTAGVVGGGGNILINGVAGTLGQVLAQTGAGVAWQTISSTSIFSGTSNVSVLGSGVDVVTAVGGVIIQRATSTGINVTGILNTSGNILGATGTFGALTLNGTTQSSGFINTSGNVSAAVHTGGAVTVTGFINTSGNVSAATGSFGAVNSTGFINTSGNVSAATGSFGAVNSTGFINTSGNVSAAVHSGGQVAVTGLINTAGNVLASQFVGSGSLLTALPGYAYSNVNVIAYLAGGITTTGFINTSGNVSAAVHTGGAISVTGFINTSGNVSAATGVFGAVNSTGFINTSGNVSAAVHTGGAVTVTGFINTTANVSAAQGMIGSLGVGTTASGTVGEIRATNNITAYYSDGRLKENIRPIVNAIDKVNAIRGVTFNANDLAATFGYTDRTEQVGVIAQEIEAVLPQIVVPAPFDIAKAEDGSEYSKSGENYKTVYYDKLVPLLIEAIKELSARVSTLEGK